MLLACALELYSVPVPPPVKLAPLGYSQTEMSAEPRKERGRALKDGTRTPIGLELSTKAQLLEVQRHSPLIGSQKAVEQLAGTDISIKTR